MMIRKNDSAVSVVIGFIVVVSIIAIAVGMWALLGIPGQVREANEIQTVQVIDSLTDYKVMLSNLHNGNLRDLEISTLMPIGSSYASGVMSIDGDKIGTLRVYCKKEADESENLIWSQDVNRLKISVGKSKTEVGYEGGGVYRCDDGYYVWSVYPSLNIYNSGGPKVALRDISNIAGKFSVGGSGEVAFNTKYLSENHKSETIKGSSKTIEDGDKTMKIDIEESIKITYTTSDPADAGLWYSLFYETYSIYNLDENDKPVGIYVDVSGNKLGDYYIVSMTVISKGEEATAVEVSLYGYKYNAELVPDIVVKMPEYTWETLNDKYKIKNIVEAWTDNDNIKKKYIYYDYPEGPHYYSLVSETESKNGILPSSKYSEDHPENLVLIDTSHVYSSKDPESFWISTPPKKGSLFENDGVLYIYTKDGSPSGFVRDDWAIIN